MRVESMPRTWEGALSVARRCCRPGRGHPRGRYAMRFRSLVGTALGALVVLALPLAASADHWSVKQATSTFEYTKNLKPLGYSAELYPNNPNFDGWNADLAFWGKKAFQGESNGFRILDISSPR